MCSDHFGCWHNFTQRTLKSIVDDYIIAFYKTMQNGEFLVVVLG
jgi:hypothetical protein